MEHSIRLQETIVYYDKTKTLTVSSGFQAARKRLHYIDIERIYNTNDLTKVG